jgi:hypothetical protein
VRHEDRRHRQVALQTGNFRAHLDAQLRVEVRERLVHQERTRLADDRAAHRDALALAAGQRPRALLQHVRQAEHRRRSLDPRHTLTARHLSQLQAEGHVVERAHVRVERVVLEDHRDVAVLRRQPVHDVIADANRPLGDVLEPGDHPQRRGLAAAGRTDEDNELPVADLEVQPGDGLRAVRVDLRQLLELNLRHGWRNLTAPS